MQTLGDRLRWCATERGLSEDQIAEHLGVSKRSVNSYFNDDRRPTFENLVSLAELFQVTTDFILTGSDPADPLLNAASLTSGQRLARWRRAAGMSLDDFAKKIGASVSWLIRVERDDIALPETLLIQLSGAFGVNRDWLLSGSGPVMLSGKDERVAPPLNRYALQDFVQVPVLEASLSAGFGVAGGPEEVIGNLAFRSDWLRREAVQPGSASLVRVRGESMEPTLRDGAMVLVDHSRKDPARKDIYAFRIGEDVLVKRLHRQGDVLLINSDNPAYDSQAVTGPSLAEVEIIGRVVWQGYTFRSEVKP